jgi:hypothetical protein
MPVNQEIGPRATPRNVYQMPAAKHHLRSRNSLPEQEQSVKGLLDTVDNLQRIVCELLLQNQILRMDRVMDGETAPQSSAIRVPDTLPLESGSFI